MTLYKKEVGPALELLEVSVGALAGVLGTVGGFEDDVSVDAGGVVGGGFVGAGVAGEEEESSGVEEVSGVDDVATVNPVEVAMMSPEELERLPEPEDELDE